MSDDELWRLGALDVAGATRAGSISSVEVVRACLGRLDAIDGNIHAFVHVDAEGALRAAGELTREAARGVFRGPLHGVPVAVKDIIDVAGMPTRRGSRAFASAVPATRDAAAVACLRLAGAVIIGKTATHELACGIFTPGVRNPWNLEYSCGGSSGGSAAAVAAGIVPAAIGSDTGGSIRIPASVCGVVGMKPTYGALDVDGVVPLSWSLDHLAALARGVEDVAAIVDAMRRPDGVHAPRRSLVGASPLDISTVTIGVPRQLGDVEHDEVAQVRERACDALRARGARVVDVSIPLMSWSGAAESTIFMAEAAAAHMSALGEHLDLIGRDVRATLEAGAAIPATLYLRAQRVRGAIGRALQRASREHGIEFLCSATMAIPAYRIPGPGDEHESLAIVSGATGPSVPFNLCGMPAISLPVGVDKRGLPVGVQFAAPAGHDARLVALGRAVEDACAGFVPAGPASRMPGERGRRR